MSTTDQFALWVKRLSKQKKALLAESAANGVLVLLAVACSLLDRQIASQAEAFQREGGFTERLYRTRMNARGWTDKNRRNGLGMDDVDKRF